MPVRPEIPAEIVAEGGKKRRRLTDKVAASGVYGSKTSGEDLFVAAQKHRNVVDAKTALFLSDGDPALEAIRQNHFPQAPHQPDLRHVTTKVREARTWQHIDAAKKLLGHIFSADRESFEKQSIFDSLRYPGRRAHDRQARSRGSCRA